MNTRFGRFALLVFIAACGLLFNLTACKSGQAPDADELRGVKQFVANGSFEEMDGESPKGWMHRNWQRGSDALFAVGAQGRTGGRSVAISSEKGADASWIAVVPIRPYSRYRLSGFIKTENVIAGTGRGAQINIHGQGEWRTAPLTGTSDWSRVECEFDAGANDALEVSCLLGGWGRAHPPLRPRPRRSPRRHRRR
jgi:hypothetical protein